MISVPTDTLPQTEKEKYCMYQTEAIERDTYCFKERSYIGITNLITGFKTSGNVANAK